MQIVCKVSKIYNLDSITKSILIGHYKGAVMVMGTDWKWEQTKSLEIVSSNPSKGCWIDHFHILVFVEKLQGSKLKENEAGEGPFKTNNK